MIDTALLCREVPGMTSPVELQWLHDQAAASPAAVVEIGCCAGRSTIALALGARLSGRKVYAVDPFNGGGATPPEYINQGVSFKPFWGNICKFGVQDIVTPIVEYSGPAAGKYPGDPIGLLFIDADHTYRYVRMDVDLWGKFLVQGAVLALHDSGYPGVRQVINELGEEYTDRVETPVFHVTMAKSRAEARET